MVLASLPFVRFVQMMAGQTQPMFRDRQVRGFLITIVVLVLVVTIYRVVANDDHLEHALREGLFNVTSIITGTGYASVDYQLWGGFPVILFFFIGLIGDAPDRRVVRSRSSAIRFCWARSRSKCGASTHPAASSRCATTAGRLTRLF